jgi:hypothetical protein
MNELIKYLKQDMGVLAHIAVIAIVTFAVYFKQKVSDPK